MFHIKPDVQEKHIKTQRQSAANTALQVSGLNTGAVRDVGDEEVEQSKCEVNGGWRMCRLLGSVSVPQMFLLQGWLKESQ